MPLTTQLQIVGSHNWTFLRFNLLVWLTELSFLTRLQLIAKHRMQPMEEMCRAKYKKRGAECPRPLGAPSPISTCSPSYKSSEPNTLGNCGGFTTQAWLSKSPAADFELSPPPFLPPWRSVNGTRRQPGPILRLPRSFVSLTKSTFMSLPTVKSKGFRSSVPGTGMKTKYLFLIINHHIKGQGDKLEAWD